MYFYYLFILLHILNEIFYIAASTAKIVENFILKNQKIILLEDDERMLYQCVLGATKKTK